MGARLVDALFVFYKQIQDCCEVNGGLDRSIEDVLLASPQIDTSENSSRISQRPSSRGASANAGDTLW